MTLIKSISGIRGTIGGPTGDTLNPLDIVKFTTAYAQFIAKNAKTGKIVVGRDGRISGLMVRNVVVGTLMGMGYDVIDIGYATTPTTELAVRMAGADGGIIITASHNPRQWNALKLLNSEGEFLTAADGAEVLRMAEAEDFNYAEVDKLGTCTIDDSYNQRHIDSVLALKLVDREAIKKRKFRVCADTINSVGGIILPDLFNQLGVDYEILNRDCTLGMICDHQCQHKCTRMNYDSSILIREIKRFIAAKNENRPALQPGQDNGKKVAIIGAGPSGLAAAYFLRLEGFGVDVFETKAFAGGMISDAIPAFRLTDEAIRKDVDFIAGLGANIHYNEKIDANRFEEIRNSYNYVYVAVGAQVAKKMGVPGEDAQGVLDQLTFLSDVRRGKDVNLGERVVVIGGGNSAMDAARTALRLGNGTKVTLAYRRTKAEMPADPDEVVALAEEGVEILELHAPVEVVVNDGKVTAMRLQKMKLGEKGADGRRKPVAIEGAIVDVPCTSIISAIGQGVKVDFVDSAILRANPVTGETSLPNVFAGGDVSRGAATVVKACGDGRIAAMNIVAKAGQEFGIKPMKVDKGLSASERMRRSATKIKGLKIPEIPVADRCGLNKVVIRELTDEEAKAEAGRCLFCNDVCNVCVSVCPNRANRSYTVKTGDYPIYKSKNKMGTIVLEKEGTFRLTQANQVLNIGDFCNECANCTMFCPSAGDPYKQKPKFYLTEESFKAEENGYRISGNVLRERVKGREYSIEERDDCLFFSGNHMEARINKETFAVMDAMPKNGGAQSYSFENAIKMAILYMAVKDQAFNF